MALVLASAGCGSGHPRSAARELRSPLPMDVLADTALRPRFPGAAPVSDSARLTLVRIAPTRAGVQVALPVPPAASPEAARAPEAGESLPVDDELKPPIAREPARMRLGGTARGWVELDVRVDENGEVSDALFAGGEADSVSVSRAIEAALGMRYFPATQRGRPVPVWSRQRFDLGR